MTYYGSPPTLIARRGYAGLSGAESCGPNQQWDPNFVFNGIKGQCTPKGSPMAEGEEGWLSKIGNFFSGAVKGAINIYGSTKVAEGQNAAYQQMLLQQQANQMPSWVLPVAIGGVGLVAVLMLRGGARRNPAGRRRRRRRAGSRRRRLYRRRRR